MEPTWDDALNRYVWGPPVSPEPLPPIESASHIAVATPYTFIDTDSLVATYTMNEAATTVLDIFGVTVTYV